MKKSIASVTIAASLFGGAVGAIAFAPGLVSAQTEAATASEDPVDGDARPERGAWLADVLAGLVEDGTLTEDQAASVEAAIMEARPERPEGSRGRGPGGFGGVGELSDLLGLEPGEIGEALRSGSSLADIAAAQGVEPQDLIDAMVDRAAERLEEAVAAGRMDEAAAAERLAEVSDRIAGIVDGDVDFGGRGRGAGPFGDRGGRHSGHGGAGGMDGAGEEPGA